jgi:hypothetical protein
MAKRQFVESTRKSGSARPKGQPSETKISVDIPTEVRAQLAEQPATVAAITPPPVEAVAQEKKMNSITLQKKSTQKNGVSTYTAEGLGASVYFNQTFWTDKHAPDEVTITAAEGVIAEPGEAKVNTKDVTPERAQKAADAALKAQDRLTKATERAKKQQELADRLKAALASNGGDSASA